MLDLLGLARFVGVPLGRHAVGVELEGAVPVQRSVERVSGAGTRLVVHLGRGALHGVVRDPAGAAVAGARGQIESVPGSTQLDRVVAGTDASGRYQAQHLVGGGYQVTVDL